MSAIFFISPFEPPVWDGDTHLQTNPVGYRDRLRTRWPDAESQILVDSETHVLEWELYPGDTSRKMSGGLQVGQIVVSMKGSIRSIAEFAVWHRAQIHEEHRLYLFDDGLHVSMDLTSETTQQEIVRAIEAS